MTFTKFSL
jgi:hypothetical protein